MARRCSGITALLVSSQRPLFKALQLLSLSINDGWLVVVVVIKFDVKKLLKKLI